MQLTLKRIIWSKIEQGISMMEINKDERNKISKKWEKTFCCTVEIYPIADSTSKDRGVQERQCIICCKLPKIPTESIIMIKNWDCKKGKTTYNHVLQQKIAFISNKVNFP